MHVIVVGAGFGGLACAVTCAQQGLKVTLLDQVPEFLPVGELIGLGSNVAQIFKLWGILPAMKAIRQDAPFMTLHNYDGKVLAVDNTLGEAEEKFGAPNLSVFRGEMHAILVEYGKSLGIIFRNGCKVVDYDANKPSVILASGEEVEGDAVIASDGIKSIARGKVLGDYEEPLDTGYTALRAYGDASLIAADPIAKHLVENGDSVSLWVGPDLHGIALALRGGKELFTTITYKRTPGQPEIESSAQVLELIKDWDVVFKRTWELLPDELNIWPLVYRNCSEKWVSDSGLIALIGDAVHPFLPSSMQGAGQAMEDGAVLGLCLAKAGKGSVPLALNTFFRLRHDHVVEVQEMGIEQREYWHNNHDESGEMVKKPDDTHGAVKTQKFWSYDCVKVVEESWETVSAQVAAELGL
ncbi:uncharacterized protein N7479_010258 [Penicillium vulpinum]|uniref:FAD-binding domain-containing protein n=1 Tax=Penicillium vulpinum TaxID=29845 RepID=A0A1V6RGV4_9EURO|nr:uncharacterized protein N7479_010258 [Penicillium vulpinum]KAJ5951845.1 hypothetical protein N7479_010258 [Penicillium vulpinum]OQE00623.1 hypothetical protein PENVUL_c049G04970 [Penicillium vulpinum]